jgi:hypothetical protein
LRRRHLNGFHKANGAAWFPEEREERWLLFFPIWFCRVPIGPEVFLTGFAIVSGGFEILSTGFAVSPAKFGVFSTG